MSNPRVMLPGIVGPIWSNRRSVRFTAFRFPLFLLLSLALTWAFLYAILSTPYGAEGQVVEVEVKGGEPFSLVAQKLNEEGVITSRTLFTLWARVSGLDRKLGSGRYRFDLPLSARDVMNQLVLGKGAFHRVTIPEGLTVKEIAELLEKLGLGKKERFLAQARDPKNLVLLGLPHTGAEGYLFADTYHLAPGASEAEIVKIMANQFRQVFTDAMEERARELGLTRHEVVTLASLVEKETGVESERPLISAVFHNRLKLKMRLQSDPTVIYGLDNFSGNLTREHLRIKTPYNTYLTEGLPPSPICNPSLPSLLAALYPAAVPYLYFVSRNDGSHYFSVTFEEHNRAVKIYQQKVRHPAKPPRPHGV